MQTSFAQESMSMAPNIYRILKIIPSYLSLLSCFGIGLLEID